MSNKKKDLNIFKKLFLKFINYSEKLFIKVSYGWTNGQQIVGAAVIVISLYIWYATKFEYFLTLPGNFGFTYVIWGFNDPWGGLLFLVIFISFWLWLYGI